MARRQVRVFLAAATAVACWAALLQTVMAGPPLWCHPFDIGDAKSLPWEGGNWRAPRPDYDVNRLIEDATALLSSNQPVIVRMETLRRAAIYAMKDTGRAQALHERLSSRVRSASAEGEAAALAWFDLGYLEATYKQGASFNPPLGFAAGFNGYALVTKAIALSGGNSEMEFAAAIIARDPGVGAWEQHLRKALGGAANDALLSRNLISHFADRGKTIAEMTASVGPRNN